MGLWRTYIGRPALLAYHTTCWTVSGAALEWRTRALLSPLFCVPPTLAGSVPRARAEEANTYTLAIDCA